MQKGLIIGVFIVAVAFALLSFVLDIHYENKHTGYKNQDKALAGVQKANFDNMWKSINQIAQVPEAAKDAFSQMYLPLIEGRYGTERGGALFSWIQEQQPQFDWGLYGNVQTVVDAKRQEFFNIQKQRLDVKREDDDLRLKAMGSWFIDESDSITVAIITSAKTDEVFETGQENDVTLFPKK